MKRLICSFFTLLAWAGMNLTAAVPAQLHWIGKTPEAAKPVSFGIPFNRGEMKVKDAFVLNTDKGEVIPADFWPTAYWPDGSVKWGGFAAVVPGGTEEVSLSPGPSPVREGGIVVNETDRQFCINTGDFIAYIPKRGTAILDSLMLGGTRVAGYGQLICTTQDQPYVEGISDIHFTNYVSRIDKVEVERAGNVRAVVKIEGTYNNIGSAALPPTGGAGRGAFTLRLYFYTHFYLRWRPEP